MTRRISALLIAAAALLSLGAAYGQHTAPRTATVAEAPASTAGGHTAQRSEHH
ncbi:hypothetical protein ACIQWA_10305 [Kitasatospora sp. NPDC098652]|uniref:hypothetical protein n=1 Tax=Kitasatospora sp. NPDC098652 TaxID=3364095 RepID=UPI0037FF0403